MQLLKSASDALQRHKANVALYVGAAVFGVYVGDGRVTEQNPDVAIAPTLAQRLIDVTLLIGITAGGGDRANHSVFAHWARTGSPAVEGG